VFHARVSPSGGDDQIDFLFAGNAANLFKRSSFHRMRIAGPQLDPVLLRELFQMPANALRYLDRRKNDRHRHHGGERIVRLINVDQVQLSPGPFRQAQRGFECFE
jgi:hypothetical protein